MKKIATMNMDLSKVAGKSNTGSSSVSSSTNSLLVNGGLKDNSSTNVVNEYKFPPGGIPSLRLPVVILLDSCCICLHTLLTKRIINACI